MLLKGTYSVGDSAISAEYTETSFTPAIASLAVCIDEQLSFNAHAGHVDPVS